MRNPIRLKNLRLRFLPYYVAGGALLVWSPIRWPAFGTGLPLVLGGVALRTWAVGHLVKNDRFTVTGPYAHVRHPLYLGTLLVALGFASMLPGWIALIVLAAVSTWFALHYLPRKERVEAERLRARYGEAFERYRIEVPALLPRLTRWSPAAQKAANVPAGVRWSPRRYDANNELGTLIAILLGLVLLAWRASLAT